MIATMIFPGDLCGRSFKQRRLRLYCVKRAVSRRRPVLITSDGFPLNASQYRKLRREAGVWIETNQPETVCALLGLGHPDDEPGIHRIE